MSDDEETNVSLDQTDAGSPLANNITADTTPDGKPNYHGPDGWKRASLEYQETAESFKSKEQEPRIEIVEDDRPVLKHRFKNKEAVVTAAEAARELEQQQELREDPTYSKTVDLLDKLVEAGSDREEAEVDYKNAILAAEQRLAARRMGLYDEQPNEAPAEQHPAEQPTEQPAQMSPEERLYHQIQHAAHQQPQFANCLAQLVQAAREVAPNIQTPADLANISPEQSDALQQLDAEFRRVSAHAQSNAIIVATAQQEQFANYAAAEDAKFEKSIPKGVDKKELSAAAVDYLKEDLGWSDQQITRMWHSDPQFRSADAQKLMMAAALRKLDQTKAEAARKNLNARRAPVPQVQRHGVGQAGQSRTSEATLVAAFEAACRGGSQKQQLAAGARLNEHRARELNKARETWR